MNIGELVDQLQSAEGFLVSASILKEGKIEHFLFIEKFPSVDLLPSHKEVKELIVNELENQKVKE